MTAPAAPATSTLLDPTDLARLERLAIAVSQRVEGTFGGAHRARSHGQSLDFADWREYQPGDDPRSIDVMAWARLDQLLVRVYEADVDLSVHILVDTSASMGFGSKLRTALRLAASLAVVALMRNETVALSPLGRQEPTRLRGRPAIGQTLQLLESWSAEGPTPLGDSARRFTAGRSRAGLIVLISDFLAEDAAVAIDTAAARRDPVEGICIVSERDDRPDLAGQLQLVDSESGDYVDVDVDPQQVAAFATRRAQRRAALATRMAKNGGRWTEVNDTDDLFTTIVPQLVRSGAFR